MCKHKFIKHKESEGQERVLFALFTFGLSELQNDTYYRCSKCGVEIQKSLGKYVRIN